MSWDWKSHREIEESQGEVLKNRGESGGKCEFGAFWGKDLMVNCCFLLKKRTELGF